MKKSFYAVVFCMIFMNLLAGGCTDSKTDTVADTAAVDTIDSDTLAADSLDSIIAATPMPKAADAMFNDFFFNFAANKKVQRERILFPLRVIVDGKLSQMAKEQWKIDYFFMREGYYTLLFDNLKQMDIANDTSIKQTVVEKIYLDRKRIEQYKFKKLRGAWMLVEIEKKPMASSKNSSFLAFYNRFSCDEAFQVSSLHEPVKMTVPDPDDDFKMMTGDIYPEQWIDYRPQILPKGLIYNINYGQSYTNDNQKVFVIRGIANGLESQLTFKKTNGKWKLTQFIN